jgi:hypothetical protein
MVSVRSCKGLIPLTILFQVLFLSVGFSSFGQIKQSYRNHEEIDVGGGMKVEILKCTGDGPTEECDCIYFTDKRQNGTRMKQNANRIKEEERAANLVKGINNPETKKTQPSSAADVTDSRPDKDIPESILYKPNVPPAKRGVSLEEAARQADSVAKVGSQKLKESLSKINYLEDSTEMDRVYIPKVTETGEIRLQVSAPTVNAETTAASVDSVAMKETTKNVTFDTTSSQSKVLTSPDVAEQVPVAKKDTVVSATSGLKNGSANAPSIATTITKKDSLSNLTIPADTVTTPSAKKQGVVLKDTSVIITASDSAKIQTTDSSDHWVKQYEHIKPTSENVEQPVNKTSPTDEKRTDTIIKVGDEVLKSASKTESETTGSGVMSSLALNGKSFKKKEDTTKISNVNTLATTRDVTGKTAEVNSKGEWEKVTIIDKETEFLYKVHYPGKSADHDEWVAVTQIRNIDSTTKTIDTGKPDKLSKVNAYCKFEAPAPPVLNADKFSEKLAKRKIYDSYVADKKGHKTLKTGITFLSLRAEPPYVNTVSISANNILEVKFSFAPAGAMIYPVTTQLKVCEQDAGKTTSKIVDSNYACFRNKEGFWTCAKVE